MKKETLVSIAERSGCSISTVSRVLSGNAAKYRISQRTVARVTEEVKRCNYTPSLLAKGLRTNRTDTIGLLIPNIENSFFANVAGVVIRESRNYNYKVVVVDTQEDERNEQDGLSALLARRVDGIVIVSSPQELVGMIVGKAVQMAQMMHVPILGLVENMSYAVCPDCGKHINVFGDSHVDEIADKYKLPVLAKMPIDPELAKEADAGMIEMFAGDYLDNAAQTVAKLLKK